MRYFSRSNTVNKKQDEFQLCESRSTSGELNFDNLKSQSVWSDDDAVSNQIFVFQRMLIDLFREFLTVFILSHCFTL